MKISKPALACLVLLILFGVYIFLNEMRIANQEKTIEQLKYQSSIDYSNLENLQSDLLTKKTSDYQAALELILKRELNQDVAYIKLDDEYIYFVSRHKTVEDQPDTLNQYNTQTGELKVIGHAENIIDYLVSPNKSMTVLLTSIEKNISTPVDIENRNLLYFLNEKGELINQFVLDSKIKKYDDTYKILNNGYEGMFLKRWSIDGQRVLVDVGDYGWNYNFIVDTSNWEINYYEYDRQPEMEEALK